jgi:hypothetical protein
LAERDSPVQLDEAVRRVTLLNEIAYAEEDLSERWVVLA